MRKGKSMTGFEKVKKNFGFGCMRLPMKGSEVDYGEFSRMVDTYIAAGFNYFDTARVYLGGQSETAIRECIAKRYPREAFVLADKLSASLFNSQEEIRPLFEKQLESCGVEYFDFYLMHAQKNINAVMPTSRPMSLKKRARCAMWVCPSTIKRMCWRIYLGSTRRWNLCRYS